MRRLQHVWTAVVLHAMSFHKAASSQLPLRPAARSAGKLPLPSVLQTVDNSLKRALKPDPSSEKEKPNQTPREVFGHWVDVEPTALPDPYIIALAPAMAAEFGLDPKAAEDPAFVRFFSGDVAAAREAGILIQPWATPYAVSVFGQAIASPDPFGGGNAYGDGRAVSLGEFMGAPPENGGGGPSSAVPPTTTGEPRQRWELQLKGSGTTPFSRGGDGRAVLRSSVREFLVSEAMYSMGVPTTRALCLIASGSQYTRRMWYADTDVSREDHPPDTMIIERCAAAFYFYFFFAARTAPHAHSAQHSTARARTLPRLPAPTNISFAPSRSCAITCRAAPSFIRVGHLELWSRRAARGVDGAATELRSLVEHALIREFAGEVDRSLPFKEQLFAMMRVFAKRQARERSITGSHTHTQNAHHRL